MSEDYPHDFYSQKLSVEVVIRKTSKQPETLKDYFDALNLKADCIQALAFFLGAVSTSALVNTNPENLKAHIESLAFLMMSFASTINDEEDRFKEQFKL